MKWTSWANVVLGLWLIIAPFIIGYYGQSTVATGEAVILGLLIAGCSFWVTLVAKAFLTWLVALFGVWVVIAPFLLRYTAVTSALVNDAIVGVLVLAVAVTHVTITTRQLTRPSA